MKKILFVALAAVGLTACVQNEELSVPQSDVIAFGNAYLDNAVRGAEDPSTTTNSISGFNVWGFMDTNAGTVFTAQEVEKNNGVWGYNGTQYWTPGHLYHFSALSPMNSANWQIGTATTEGIYGVAFTNVAGTEDLLYATTEVSTAGKTLTSTYDVVTMPFYHILSKVKFTFTNGFGTDNMYVKVSEVKMTAPESGTIDLDGEFTNYQGNWVLGSGATTLAFGDVEKLAMGTNAEVAAERFTIPAGTDYVYNVSFKVTVYAGTEKALEVDKTATISGYALEMGKAYNFTAEINPDNLGLAPIEFTATVEDWVPAGDVPVGYYIGANGEYVVSTAAGLEQIVEDINNGNDTDRTVVLDGDLDLLASRSLVSNWTPLGNENQVFEGTFDGNGHTIKNLVLVADEPGYFYGFFGCAENATIKNVNFENITVNIPSDDTNSGGHIAGIAGYAQNVTFEDITVSGDVKVESTFDANASSRVAVVAGGNYGGTVTMKNVHVNVNAGSYVKANNCVGALAGQLQGVVVFENCSSNIDVYGYKFFAGGLIGLTANNSTFTNCHTSGNVSIEHGRANNINDLYRVGAIAGGWDESYNLPLVLENCSYTGTISGKDADGNVANPLDCAGYVGRGYSAKAGTVVEIDGVSYKYLGNGQFEISIPVSTSEELVAALAAGKSVYLLNDITVAATNGGYKKAGILQNKAQTIDGGGHTLTVTGAGGTWDCAIYTNGGTIKNLTVKGAMRGIFTAGQSADLHIENVEFKNVIYTFNSDGKMPANPFGVYVSNSKVNGWTSHSNMHTEVVYTNCSFGEGSGYKYCRPYGKTAFVGCTFCAGYTLDKSMTTDITLTDCIFE